MYDLLPHSCIRYHVPATGQYLVCILLRLMLYIRNKIRLRPCAECWKENCSKQAHLKQIQFLGDSCIIIGNPIYQTLLDGVTHNTRTNSLIKKEKLCELNTKATGYVTPRPYRNYHRTKRSRLKGLFLKLVNSIAASLESLEVKRKLHKD